MALKRKGVPKEEKIKIQNESSSAAENDCMNIDIKNENNNKENNANGGSSSISSTTGEGEREIKQILKKKKVQLKETINDIKNESIVDSATDNNKDAAATVKTPKKVNNFFQSFTPLKSNISSVSPFKTDFSLSFSTSTKKQNNNSRTLNKAALFKPQIENIFIPESPMNIKLKSSTKIRPLARKSTTNHLLFKFNQMQQDEEKEEEEMEKEKENDINNRIKLSVSQPNLPTNNNLNTMSNSEINEQLLEDMIKRIDGGSSLERNQVSKFLYNQAPDIVFSNEIPIDQSLKTQITITSPTIDFRLFNDAFADHSMLSKLIGAKNTNQQQQQQDSKPDKLEIFLSSLIHYISPANSLPWDIEKEVVSKDPVKMKWIEDRWREWETSFNSLFYSYLAGSVEYFYLLHAEWSCLFMYLDGLHYAKINPTTQKIRDLLKEDGIEWTTPYLQSVQYDEVKVSAEMLKELKELSKNHKASKSYTKKKLDPSYYQTPRSSTILLVTGLEDVEKLGNFFMNRLIWSNKLHSKPDDNATLRNSGNTTSMDMKATSTTTSLLSRSSQIQTLLTPKKLPKHIVEQQQSSNDDEMLTAIETQYYLMCKDVPTLLSKQPFNGGTLRLNRISANDVYTKLTVSSSQPGTNSDAEKSYRIEIDGPLTPDSCKNLLELMTTHNQPFNCQQYTNETTYGFNNNSTQLGRNVIKQIQYNPINNNSNNNSNNNNSVDDNHHQHKLYKIIPVG